MCSEGTLQQRAEIVLKEIGIHEGQTVLDCCCGRGVYTLAAALLVGDTGLVYAIDNNGGKLKGLRQEVNSRCLTNIKTIEESVESVISLSSDAVDIALLYDIFWYFRPGEKKLSSLLDELYRVTKLKALISISPAHLSSDELNILKQIMEGKAFSLQEEYSTELIHEGKIEKGRLLNFKKTSGRIEVLEMKIGDLQARIPAHSISPSMMEELEELEEQVAEAKRKKVQSQAGRNRQG